MLRPVKDGGFRVVTKQPLTPYTGTGAKIVTGAAQAARPTTFATSIKTGVAIPSTVSQVPDRTVTTTTTSGRATPSALQKAVSTFVTADKKITANIADKLNVTTKTVNTVGLISLIGTGAGLLANGVKSLFDGSLKEKRAIKKAEKAEAKEVKKQAAIATAATAATKAYVGLTGGGQGAPALGSYEQSGQGGMMQQAGPFLKKNWMWIAAAALLLFGGKLLKPKRRPARRRAAPKTVVRYRTRRTARKAPVRRKR